MSLNSHWFQNEQPSKLNDRKKRQLRKINITPLAILGVKWPFSKGRGG